MGLRLGRDGGVDAEARLGAGLRGWRTTRLLILALFLQRGREFEVGARGEDGVVRGVCSEAFKCWRRGSPTQGLGLGGGGQLAMGVRAGLCCATVGGVALHCGKE